MKNNIITILFMFPLLLAYTSMPVFAYSVPDFGSCLNPQTSASQVNSGSNHGVVGYDNQSFSGIDIIYYFSDNNVLQCLCTDDGNGYQTKWVKADIIGESDRKVMESEGWNYLSDAGSWGLNGSYLAKTDKYSCKGASQSEVLGLASTGNSTFIYGLIVAGAVALISGMILRRVSK